MSQAAKGIALRTEWQALSTWTRTRTGRHSRENVTLFESYGKYVLPFFKYGVLASVFTAVKDGEATRC